MTEMTLVASDLTAGVDGMIERIEGARGGESEGKTGNEVNLQTAAIDVARDREIVKAGRTTLEDPDHLLRRRDVTLAHR